MNDRIKELAELSGFKVDWQHEDVQTLKMARFEKFAELIVQECMKLNSKELSITAIERLLPLYAEHFGVKE